jgi:hypothetical protein
MKKYIFTFLFLIISITIYSQIPRTISYQGVLTDASGSIKPDGNYDFIFTLYDSQAGGNALWSENKNLKVSKGIFSTSLGDQTPFGAIVKFDEPYWLGIKIGGDAELSPRIALTSAGYSINSATAQDVAVGKVVKSINGLKDDITITGGGGTTVNSNNNQIIISSSGSGSSGMQGIQNTDNALEITNPNGPTATVNLHNPFIINNINVGIGVNSPAAKLDVNGGSGNGAGIGIHGSSNDNFGIYGTSNNSFGLFGESAGSNGVYAKTYATGSYALIANNGSGNNNYCGLSSGSYSIFANGPALFSTIGIGTEPDQNPTGIKLKINGAINIDGSSYFSGAMGIGVSSPAGKLDVNGGSGNGAGIGIHGSSNDNYGVYGSSNSSIGVFGESGSSTGLRARTYSGASYALFADNGANSKVFCALASSDYGIYATGDRFAGYFDGAINVNGPLNVTGGKYFKIDHPLDPANKYLIHSCIESPDRMNIYNGNIITDANGSANVELPSYFETLNVDFRYQLTVIGQFAQAIIESKIQNNHFTIRTDKPNVEVSWQVTGIRNDAYAKAHPMVVEEEKAPNERGKYLMPELFGQPKEMSINYIKPVLTEYYTNSKETKNENK